MNKNIGFLKCLVNFVLDFYMDYIILLWCWDTICVEMYARQWGWERLSRKGVSYISKNNLLIQIQKYEAYFTENWIQSLEIYALEWRVNQVLTWTYWEALERPLTFHEPQF